MIVRLPSCATMALLVRGSVRASSTTTGTFGGEDLLQHRVAVDRDPGRHVPDEILAGAAVAEDADERRLLLVGDAQPGVIEADGVPHLGAGRLEHVHEGRGAPQLSREREQPAADGKPGAVHVNPYVEAAQSAS